MPKQLPWETDQTGNAPLTATGVGVGSQKQLPWEIDPNTPQPATTPPPPADPESEAGFFENLGKGGAA